MDFFLIIGIVFIMGLAYYLPVCEPINSFISPYIDKVLTLRPFHYGYLYSVNIILFSVIYYLSKNEFKDNSIDSPIQFLYFSVVTVTTLGYGDVLPDLKSELLLFIIMLQVLSGIVIIGLFLNSLSQKLSDKKDEMSKKEKNKIEKELIRKQLLFLKPIIEDHLKVLSRIYTETATVSKDNYHIFPVDLFNQEYYDRICIYDSFAEITVFDPLTGNFKKKINCEELMKKYDEFIRELNDYLLIFASSLPIDITQKIMKIKSHYFLKSAKKDFDIYSTFSDSTRYLSLSLLHSESDMDFPENELTVSLYHDLLLSLIERIDKFFPNDKIKIFVRLRKDTPDFGKFIGTLAAPKT